MHSPRSPTNRSPLRPWPSTQMLRPLSSSPKLSPHARSCSRGCFPLVGVCLSCDSRLPASDHFVHALLRSSPRHSRSHPKLLDLHPPKTGLRKYLDWPVVLALLQSLQRNTVARMILRSGQLVRAANITFPFEQSPDFFISFNEVFPFYGYVWPSRALQSPGTAQLKGAVMSHGT